MTTPFRRALLKFVDQRMQFARDEHANEPEGHDDGAYMAMHGRRTGSSIRFAARVKVIELFAKCRDDADLQKAIEHCLPGHAGASMMYFKTMRHLTCFASNSEYEGIWWRQNYHLIIKAAQEEQAAEDHKDECQDSPVLRRVSRHRRKRVR